MPRTMRDRTVLFYLIVILLSLALIVILIERGSRPHSRAALAPTAMGQLVLLDAGHGGEDGGATVAGVSEAPINIAITQKAALIFRFLGQDVGLTRRDGGSLGFVAGATTRENKNADLKARLALWKTQPGNPFLSIHLNRFSEPKYYGAQVFYSVNAAASKDLAEVMQEALRAGLDPANARQAKPCTGVFLMEQITGPAVTVECGFLSNDAERARLQQSDYQTKTALAIACGYLRYYTGWEG